MKTKIHLWKRRAISGIIGAVFLFAMLFTTGTGFFLFVANQNKQYATTLNNVQAGYRQKAAESAIVTPPSSAGSTVRIVVRNAGSSVLNITAVTLENSNGAFIQYYAKYNPAVSKGNPVPTCTSGSPSPPCNTNPNLPLYISPGASSATIDTLYTASNGVEYVVQVLTSNGNVFTGGYPFPVGQNVLLSQLSQGVGSFVLIASSLKYYYGSTSGSASCGTSESQGDGYNVNGFYANVLPYKACIALSVQMQNVDPFGRSITLNSKSVFFITGQGGTSSVSDIYWYVVSGIAQNSGPYVTAEAYSGAISVPYEGTQTLYFAATVAGGSSLTTTPSTSSLNNSPFGSFFLLYGAYGDGTPFAQTIPFTATYVTGAVVTTSGPFSGNQGATITLALSSFTVAPQAYWISNDGTTQVATTGTPTTSQVKFIIPSTASHQSYYAVLIDDGIEAFSIEVYVN